MHAVLRVLRPSRGRNIWPWHVVPRSSRVSVTVWNTSDGRMDRMGARVPLPSVVACDGGGAEAGEKYHLAVASTWLLLVREDGRGRSVVKRCSNAVINPK